jgi:hypothetical protein
MIKVYDKEKLNLHLAEAYYELIINLNLDNKIISNGIHEGLTKFMSNAYISCFKAKNKRSGKSYIKADKRLTTHYLSRKAFEKLKNNDFTDLVFEHIVPKSYIQELIDNQIEAYGKDKLTIDFIYEKVQAYWLLATVTKEEDAALTRFMPKGWDGDREKNFIRYENAKLKDELIPNPFLEELYMEID